jgi:hypothetical protein
MDIYAVNDSAEKKLSENTEHIWDHVSVELTSICAVVWKVASHWMHRHVATVASSQYSQLLPSIQFSGRRLHWIQIHSIKESTVYVYCVLQCIQKEGGLPQESTSYFDNCNSLCCIK